ncbi:hypothetical protein ACFORL_02060 [Legionella dresdenensis]|uniref:Uncharacterized protein n=1 Tax=Legionella dresdenensis TaxID=450200 RepID=A0ABV8CCX7_9GAMM
MIFYAHTFFSFRIGDRYTFAKIGLNQFTLLENELGIKKGAFTQRMKDIRELVLTHKDPALNLQGGGSSQREINLNCAALHQCD